MTARTTAKNVNEMTRLVYKLLHGWWVGSDPTLSAELMPAPFDP